MSFSLVQKAYAACDISSDGLNLQNCLTTKDGNPISEVYNQPVDLVNLVVRNAFVVAGIILFLLVLLAGYKFIQGSTKGKDEAKSMMEAALVGFMLMFAAFWIVQIIQLVTGTKLGL